MDVPPEPAPDDPLEFVDQHRPELVRQAIEAAMAMAGDVRVEVWRRRRERMLTYLHIVEGRLDYDLGERGDRKPA